MIPIHDENPTSRFAWMTVVIIAANAAAFGWELTLLQAGGLDAFVETWAFTPAKFFADPLAPAQLATIFTSMFMHAGWLHIGGNMLYLWIFGNNIEDRLGPLRFLGFYLIAGVAASLGQGLLAPSSTVPSLGASGAIAGVLGAYALLYPRARVLTAVIIVIFIQMVRLPALLVIGVWFLLQLANGVLGIGQLSTQSGGVAYFAHVFGLAAGVLMALPLVIADRVRRTRFVGWR